LHRVSAGPGLSEQLAAGQARDVMGGRDPRDSTIVVSGGDRRCAQRDRHSRQNRGTQLPW
jgi:hypothetical protein